MREDGKRWLISRMKTSGSKRRYVLNGRYADDRHIQKTKDFEDLPSHESIKSTQRFYNGKINYGLLVRFLRGRVGDNWSEIHQEILARIPSKLMEHKEMVYWYVADQVDLVDGRIWNRRSQRYVWNGEITQPVHFTQIKKTPQLIEFWVHPETNRLHRIIQIKPGSNRRSG